MQIKIQKKLVYIIELYKKNEITKEYAFFKKHMLIKVVDDIFWAIKILRIPSHKIEISGISSFDEKQIADYLYNNYKIKWGYKLE